MSINEIQRRKSILLVKSVLIMSNQRGDDLWHEGAKRNIRANRNEKRRRSNAATKSAASAARKQPDARGRPLISPTKAAGKKAAAVAGKNEANRVRAKADAKVAEKGRNVSR